MKKAILLVSFGSSHLDTRVKTFQPLFADVCKAYPDYEVREAYLSGMILRILKKREGIIIDNPDEALQKLADEGFEEVIVQPTLFTNGIEYERLVQSVNAYKHAFSKIRLGMCLLTSEEDQLEIISILEKQYAIKENRDTAFVFMGHGSEHPVSAIYAALTYRMQHIGLENAFVGAVEGYPDVETIRADVKAAGFSKAVMTPFMMVAGDHAKNDMAGDEEDSWKNLFAAEGIKVEPVIAGIGELPGARSIFIRHISEAKEL